MFTMANVNVRIVILNFIDCVKVVIWTYQFRPSPRFNTQFSMGHVIIVCNLLSCMYTNFGWSVFSFNSFIKLSLTIMVNVKAYRIHRLSLFIIDINSWMSMNSSKPTLFLNYILMETHYLREHKLLLQMKSLRKELKIFLNTRSYCRKQREMCCSSEYLSLIHI